MKKTKNINIAIIGLGYVGLPLANEFSKKFKVVGFDINKSRIHELKSGIDLTNELDSKDIINSKILFTSDEKDIKECNIYIITVPTPIDKNKTPDLKPLKNATKTVSKFISDNDIIIYESTVYPGCTEEVCVPIIEKISGLKYNIDFYCGYSPERINPGDKVNTIRTIKKVTSGSNKEVAQKINELYKEIIDAGTHLTSSIKVAEACKAIENAQRDLNISFVNELALIFDRMNIDTNEVLEAASTKWNFLKFKPGLVGGHCIGVDPYYLTYKAQSLGYDPEIILSGRRVNNNMPKFIFEKVLKLMINNKINISKSKTLILGATFKENCPDFRNSKSINLYKEFLDYGLNVNISDPYIDIKSFKASTGYEITEFKTENLKKYNCIILTVAHNKFLDLPFSKLPKSILIYDVKGFIERQSNVYRL